MGWWGHGAAERLSEVVGGLGVASGGLADGRFGWVRWGSSVGEVGRGAIPKRNQLVSYTWSMCELL
jgi:hypothetical protein